MASIARRIFLVLGTSQSRESAVQIITHWDSEPKEKLICDSGRDEVTNYLQAVDKILNSESGNERNQIISMAVTRLKHEFRQVLTTQTESVMGSNSTTELSSTIDSTSNQFRYEDFVVYEAPSKEVIDYLRSIAQRMNSCGHLEACIKAYKIVRRPYVHAIFKRLGIDELKTGDIKRFSSEELKMKIERWKQAAKVCTKILFTREKQFATQFFSGLGTTSTLEECFLYVAKDAAVSLFNFAESVSLSHQSWDRLEVILILYDVMLLLTQDANDLFLSEPGKGIRNSTSTTLSRLGDEVRRMLTDFEAVVLNEISNISDDCRVNQLTEYVMGYINLIVNYKKILMRLIVSRPSMEIPDGELRDPGSLSPLALHLVSIISVLQVNLEKKSKQYKDASLGHFFMMNNVKYIVVEIEGSRDLQEMIGAEYLNKLNENVKGAMSSYEFLTCGRLLDCLVDEGLKVSWCFTYRVSNSALRRRIKNFNGGFEEIKSVQSSWEVQDVSLRKELRQSMLEKLKPAYERFLNKFRNHLESGKQRKNCVEYSVQELEHMIMNLFARHELSSPSVSGVLVENFHLGNG